MEPVLVTRDVLLHRDVDKGLIQRNARNVDLAFTDIPRIPLYQPFVNVAMQKNISGYQYWFHRRLDYRALVKA